FAPVGQGRQVDREIGRGGVDRALHVARRVIDLAIQVELQTDASAAEGTGGSHFGYARNFPEPALEGGGQRRSDRLRIRAGQGRADGNRRDIYVRQRRDRQEIVGHHPHEEEARGEEERSRGTPDERLRNVHNSIGSWGSSEPVPSVSSCNPGSP